MIKYFRVIASVLALSVVLVPTYSAGKKNGPPHWEVTFDTPPPSATGSYITANPNRPGGNTFVPSTKIQIYVGTATCRWDTTKVNSDFQLIIDNPSPTESPLNGDTIVLHDIQWDPNQTNPTADDLLHSPIPCLYPSIKSGFPYCMMEFLNLGQHPLNYRDANQPLRMVFKMTFLEYNYNMESPSNYPMAMDTWLAVYADNTCPVPTYGSIGGSDISFDKYPTANEYAYLCHNKDGSWTIESYNNPLEFIEYGKALQLDPKTGKVACLSNSSPFTTYQSTIRTLPVSYKVTFRSKP
jgi:hypothetical protein